MKTTTILKKAKLLSNVVAVGDCHGTFGELGYRIKERYQITDSVICVCGDIGMGFHKPNYYIDVFKRLNAIAKKNNNVIFAVRGNHDKFSYFDGSFIMSNIMLVPDYFVVETAKDRILFIGGGISIDRTQRTLDHDYWLDEIPIYDEEKLIASGKPDIIISHSSPSFCYPTDKNGIIQWINIDIALIEDCSYERLVHNKIFDSLKNRDMLPLHWVYGHFHSSRTERFDGIKTVFRVIDELEFYNIPAKE